MYKRFLIAIAVLLILCPFVWASPPVPGGPYKIKVNDVAEIEIVLEKGKALGFHNPYDATSLFIREATPRREGTVSYIVQPRTAKVYLLTVWTVGEKDGATLVIDASESLPPIPIPPKPDPVPPTPVPPKPDPVPPVPPSPITSDHWFIVVEETQDRTPEMAQVLDFAKWNTLGVKYRFYDKDSPDAKKYGYDALASKFGLKLPVLFVFDKAGNIVSARELPKSFDEIKKLRMGVPNSTPISKEEPPGFHIAVVSPAPTVSIPQTGGYPIRQGEMMTLRQMITPAVPYNFSPV